MAAIQSLILIYDPYGVVIYSNGAEVPYGFTGGSQDSYIKLVNLRSRLYSTYTGRMQTIDPVKQGTNWYLYANNNPILFTDPSGLIYIIAWSYGKKDAKQYEEYIYEKGIENITIDGFTDDWDSFIWKDFTKRSSFARSAYTKRQELLQMGILHKILPTTKM